MGWAVSVWDEETTSSSAVFNNRGRIADTEDVLCVEICLTRVIGTCLVIESAIEGDNSELDMLASEI